MEFERSKMKNWKFLGSSKVSRDLKSWNQVEAGVTCVLPSHFVCFALSVVEKSPGSESSFLFSLQKRAWNTSLNVHSLYHSKLFVVHQFCVKDLWLLWTDTMMKKSRSLLSGPYLWSSTGKICMQMKDEITVLLFYRRMWSNWYMPGTELDGCWGWDSI